MAARRARASCCSGPARRTAAAYVLPGLGSATTIRAARHGVRAGVLGAALLAAHELAGASDLEPVQVRVRCRLR